MTASLTEQPDQLREERTPVRRRRWLRRTLIVIAVVSGVLAVGLYAGYRYVLSTPAGVFFTLFADENRADNFRSMDTIFPTRVVGANGTVWEFGRDERPLPVTYRFDGDDRDLEGFLTETQTTGLLVVHEGDIVAERYFQGYDAASQATSWSVAKSVVATLIGIAIEEGHIAGLDDEVVDYLPVLSGSGYDGTTVRDLLTMSSGIDFDEGYDSTFADINMIFVRAMGFGQPMLEYYAGLERVREPGTHNTYASADTGVLAALLEAATGASVSDYLATRLWQPVGMESDAHWSMDRSDAEIGFCCLNATLRDYARIGRLYAEEGMREGTRILPAGWIEAATTPEAPHLEPGVNPASDWTFGYGYQWWIPEEPRPGEFTAIGVWGQYLYVDRDRGVVIVKTSTDPDFDERDHETIAVFRAIVDVVTDDDVG